MTRDLLIRILNEWVVKHGTKVAELNYPNTTFSVPDFMAVTKALLDLKGIKGETVTIDAKTPGGAK